VASMPTAKSVMTVVFMSTAMTKGPDHH